ncbi:hypothetical protein CPB84DRAFT_1821715 [Gymnopilus junonius]|uniref:DUF6534 domain-containing protein n=1 Tax=Gymnopilus junonius TaxID=109634 RepID=A0A9P5P026_GYMJU|nr:hypothetical protein CPB84DRAFT_1821715 [Gymnopilus junonius]
MDGDTNFKRTEITNVINSMGPLPTIGRKQLLCPRSVFMVHVGEYNFKSRQRSLDGLHDSTIPSLPDNVGTQTGPRIIGYLLHYGLFGVLCTQVYLYFLAFPNDPLRNKIFVYTVFLLEILQTVSISRSAFYVFVTGYGNFAFYDRVELAWLDVPIVSGIVAFMAEGFYAYRISILSRSNWIAGVILVLACVQLGGAIGAAVVLKRAVLFSQLLGPHFTIAASVWNGGSALCDVIIAVCMTYYLSRHKAQSVRGTQVLLTRIITLVIETGTATATIATLNLILESIPLAGRPSYYQVPSEILAKVYSNSMMVVLNSRMRVTSDSPESRLHTMSRFQSDPANTTGTSRDQNAYELQGVMVLRPETGNSGEDKLDKNDLPFSHIV